MIQGFNNKVKARQKTQFDTQPHNNQQGKNVRYVSNFELSENIIFPSELGENSVKRNKSKVAYKKSEAVKELERLETEKVRGLHPGNPWIVARTFRDDTANGLTDCVVKYITLKGGFASRINSMGTFNRKLGRYIRSTTRHGIADVMACYQGRSLHIEIKVGKDRQSEHQKKVESEVTASGGYYFICKDFDSFKQWLDNL